MVTVTPRGTGRLTFNLAPAAAIVQVSVAGKPVPFSFADGVLQIDLPVACGEEHKKGVEEAVHRCLIHNTLEHPPKITIAIKDGPMAKAA